jgi:hypothetical protein
MAASSAAVPTGIAVALSGLFLGIVIGMLCTGGASTTTTIPASTYAVQ